MTDILVVLLVIVYGVLGYFSGLVRRVIGLLGLFAAYGAATAMTPLASQAWIQTFSSWSVPDARMLIYVVLMVVVILVVEAFAAAYHSKLQITFVILDRASGALVGAASALLAVTVLIYLLFAASQPSAGAPDGAQVQVATAIRSESALAPRLLQSIGAPAVVLFRPVTPVDPSAYFNGVESKLQ